MDNFKKHIPWILLLLFAVIMFGFLNLEVYLEEYKDFTPCSLQMRLGEIFNLMLLVKTVVIIGLIILFCWLVGRYQKASMGGKNLLKVMAIPMIVIWICGFVSYLWLHGASGQQYTLSENILKSIVDAFKLFLFEFDGDALAGVDVDEPGMALQADVIVKGVVMILCVLASISTSVLVISLFVSRLSAYLSLRFKRVKDANNHIYIFWGISESAVLLARSVNQAYSGNTEKKPYIIFINHPAVDEGEKRDLSGIIEDFCAPRNSLLDDVDWAEYCVSGCTLGSLASSGEDVFAHANIRRVGRKIESLLKHSTDAELHIFFLDEDSDANISAVSALRNDRTIKSVEAMEIKTSIYCHARHDGVNRVIEDCHSSETLEVKVVDSARESISLLKAMPSAQPIRFVDIDKTNPGTVRSSFTALVVGSGEAGRDAIRFLYEFGAFVDSASGRDDFKKDPSSPTGYVADKETKIVRSPFHCYAMDARADDIKGKFFTGAPAIAGARNQDGSPLVNFVTTDVNGAGFFACLEKIHKELNYVVVCLGDDKLNASTAVTIFNFIRRRRMNLDRFKIFVRSNGEDKDLWLGSVYEHYNCGAEPVIIPFGEKKSIYSYDAIVKNSFRQEGYSYFKRYTDLQSGNTQNGVAAEKMWQARHEKIMSKVQKKTADKLDVLSELRRKEYQDMSNAYHRQTKVHVIKTVCPELLEKSEYMDEISGYIKAPRIDSSAKVILAKPIHSENLPYGLNLLMDNLARLEHIRWNASHEVLGYQKYDNEVVNLHKCDERTKRHNCLIPWEALDKETQDAIDAGEYPSDYISYDYGVVATTIEMEMNGREPAIS